MRPEGRPWVAAGIGRIGGLRAEVIRLRNASRAPSTQRSAERDPERGPASDGAVLHRIVDDDRTAGGVVDDIGGRPPAGL